MVQFKPPTVEEMKRMITAGTYPQKSTEEITELIVRSYNAKRGDLEGYECPKCNNKGDYYYIRDGKEHLVRCGCMEIRANINKLKESGLYKLAQRYTLDNFEALNKWQVTLKNAVSGFIEDPNGWMYIGGQPGAGKTHLCTAAVYRLIMQGKSAKYMLWRDDVTVLKGLVNSGAEYKKCMDEYKQPDVLYIDDFLKVKRTEKPTSGDINIAFEIINYRYNNDSKITVISSEFSINRITEFDEALGSRISEKSCKNNYFINYDSDKNYRLAGGAK